MLCKNCQKEIANDSKFCEFCGNKAEATKGRGEIIEKILNKKSSLNNGGTLLTPEDLNNKMWYRALKVLYIVGVIVGIILSIGIAIGDGEISAFVIITLFTLIIAEIFKRSFYYIYLGKIFPKNTAGNEPEQDKEMDKIWAKIQTQVFPGGHKQIESEIDEVSDLLGKKYTKKQIMQAYLHIVYLFFIAEDKSVERIIQSTDIKMDNTIAKEDIVKIYNYVQDKFLRQFGTTN